MAMNAFASLLCCLGTRRRQGRVQKRPDSRGGKDHVKKSSLRGTRQRSVITRGASVEQHLDTPGPHQPSRWPRLRGMNRVFARSSPARGMTAEAEGVVETRPTADATATAVQAEEQVSDRAGGDGFSSREHGAASTIQAHFRGHLARRAFRALKSLVKLQAFARGSYVRKQANIAIRFMKVLVRLLVRVRARQLLSTQPRNGNR